ncbi:MAG: deoxynucleoside kinase [Muribaculaceae bacterium]|nr:deoxynucleoside kinase [Muribaculaceae bacterium]
MSNKPYILFSGATGVGKSTVIENISYNFKSYDLYTDPYEGNPFITDAYNKNNYVFQSQVYFLKEFIKIHKSINASKKIVLQERSIFESVNIFCKLFQANNIITNDEFVLIKELADIATSEYRNPTLILYFQASPENIVERVNLRNREFESNINMAFIKSQCLLYENWLCYMKNNSNVNIEIVDANKSPQDISKITESIISKYL